LTDGLPGGDHAENGGDKDHAAVDDVPFGTGMAPVIGIGTDTLIPANKTLPIRLGPDRRFVGKDGRDAIYFLVGDPIAAPEKLAQGPAQAVGMGVRKRCDSHPGGIDFGGGAQTGDDRDPVSATGGEQVDLGGDIVDAIDDAVPGGVEEAGGGFAVKEIAEGGDLAIGVDGADAIGHEFGLGAADGA